MIACIDSTKVINAGIGGNTTEDLLNRITDDVISQKPDLVLIMVGTNDMVNSKKMVAYDTYRYNLMNIIDSLEDEMDIVLISPLPVDTAYLFTRHDRSLFEESPNSKLENSRCIMSEIAKDRSLHFIDLFSEFVRLHIPRHNEDDIIRNISNSGVGDGVHPTEKGYQIVAELIFNYLDKNNLLSPGMKIICFGDSITKGVHMEGAGTAQGDTYPAKLSRLINGMKTATRRNHY